MQPRCGRCRQGELTRHEDPATTILTTRMSGLGSASASDEFVAADVALGQAGFAQAEGGRDAPRGGRWGKPAGAHEAFPTDESRHP